MPPERNLSPSSWTLTVAPFFAATAAGGLAWFGSAVLPVAAMPAAATAFGVFGLGLASAALGRVHALAAQSERASADIDAVSRRLLRVETALAGLARPGPVPAPAPLDEFTAELGLLSGLVRDIALTLATHDRDIGALKGRAAQAPDADGPARIAPPMAAEPSGPGQAQVAGVGPGAPRVQDAQVGRARPVASRTAPRPAPLPPEPPARDAPPADPGRDRAILQAFDGAQGLELFLQAIVTLPQRKLHLYEAGARLRLPGEEAPLEPTAFLPVLERHGRLPDLDRTILARSAVVARHLGARGSEAGVACPLSNDSVARPGFLRAIGQFLETHPELAGRLVLALPEPAWRRLTSEGTGALATIHARGLGLMLDRVEDASLDPAALAACGIGFLKLDLADILKLRASSGGQGYPADFVGDVRRAGVMLIAAGVAREGEVPDLIELDLPLAQGDVFAPPRAVRAEAMQLPPAPAPRRLEPEPVAVVAAEPDALERKPFRAFLRRAG